MRRTLLVRNYEKEIKNRRKLLKKIKNRFEDEFGKPYAELHDKIPEDVKRGTLKAITEIIELYTRHLEEIKSFSMELNKNSNIITKFLYKRNQK